MSKKYFGSRCEFRAHQYSQISINWTGTILLPTRAASSQFQPTVGIRWNFRYAPSFNFFKRGYFSKEIDMRVSKTAIAAGAMIAAMAAGTLAATSAAAETYVVCNRYDECWKVHEKYTNYPADERIVWHDEAWRAAHEHDARTHWLSDPADDHGFYDKDGAWHSFADAPPHP
jgi:hypothetical protein